MGPYCLSSSPVLGHCFPVGWEIRCTGYTPFPLSAGKFSDASERSPKGDAIYL